MQPINVSLSHPCFFSLSLPSSLPKIHESISSGEDLKKEGKKERKEGRNGGRKEERKSLLELLPSTKDLSIYQTSQMTPIFW